MARAKKLKRKSSVGDTSIHFPFPTAFYLGRTFVRILMSYRLSPSAFPIPREDFLGPSHKAVGRHTATLEEHTGRMAPEDRVAPRRLGGPRRCGSAAAGRSGMKRGEANMVLRKDRVEITNSG